MNTVETVRIAAIVSALAVGIGTIVALRQENKMLQVMNEAYKQTFDERRR